MSEPQPAQHMIELQVLFLPLGMFKKKKTNLENSFIYYLQRQKKKNTHIKTRTFN